MPTPRCEREEFTAFSECARLRDEESRKYHHKGFNRVSIARVREYRVIDERVDEQACGEKKSGRNRATDCQCETPESKHRKGKVA